MAVTVDQKRTVRATVVDDLDDETPGACYRKSGNADYPDHLVFACPGCGRGGSIRCTHPKDVGGRSWDIVAGSLADPTTLTLAPSIHCLGCCGWHGFLTDGVFKSC